MKCDENRLYLSALYDGEPIPPEAAEHAALCAECQEQLKLYAETGAVLRTYASLLISQPVPARTWLTPRPQTPTFWEKAQQTMRIPRLAFAALILVLLGLSSRLTVVEVRAHSDGPVVLLKIIPAQGDPLGCALSTTDPNHNHCDGLAQINNSNFLYSIKSLRKDGDRVLLSVRYRVDPPGPDGIDAEVEKTLPETQLWFTPGDSLPLPNAENLTLTGQWSDHIPVAFGANQFLDPNPHEIRLVAPLLLKNNQVAGDQIGSARSDQPGEGVAFYTPGEGSFTLTATQVPGAVQAKVQLNRVTFQSNNQSYVIVSGMPITRDEQLWVVHNPAYQPSSGSQYSFIAAGPVNKLLKKQ
jgi:hypothetical protein